MPAAYCKNAGIDGRECRRFLGYIPKGLLETMKKSEGAITLRCPIHKFVAVGFADGKVSFDGSVPPPKFKSPLKYDDERIVRQIG